MKPVSLYKYTHPNPKRYHKRAYNLPKTERRSETVIGKNHEIEVYMNVPFPPKSYFVIASTPKNPERY